MNSRLLCRGVYVCYFYLMQIRPLFEEHGDVVEVALIKDKRTGLQQGMWTVVIL